VRTDFLGLYADTIRGVAQEANAPAVDHFTEWVEVDPGGAMHHWIGHGCHPNEYGHRAIAHAIFRALDIWDDESWVCQLNVPR
jgi:lysophospholipase L1-like esterase